MKWFSPRPQSLTQANSWVARATFIFLTISQVMVGDTLLTSLLGLVNQKDADKMNLGCSLLPGKTKKDLAEA